MDQKKKTAKQTYIYNKTFSEVTSAKIPLHSTHESQVFSENATGLTVPTFPNMQAQEDCTFVSGINTAASVLYYCLVAYSCQTSYIIHKDNDAHYQNVLNKKSHYFQAPFTSFQMFLFNADGMALSIRVPV